MGFRMSEEAPELGWKGKYQLLRRLGRGGMGEVFEAIDPALDRRVAIKVPGGEVARHADVAERFLREARAAARLSHPNVVTVHAVETDGRWPFLVMELVEGSPARGPYPWAEATRIAAAAARGVAAAHRAGLIHRDIKPSNLLIRTDGTVKVADFGLARFTDPGVSPLTGSHVAVGTVHYMSPEQCRADEPVTELSDIYALGATYFALLTGRPPFDAAAEFLVQYAHCSADIPDVSAEVEGLPIGCGEVIRRAMAKEPAARFPSADAMADALEAILPSPTNSPGPRPIPPVQPTSSTVKLLGDASEMADGSTVPVGKPVRPPRRPRRRVYLLLGMLAVAGMVAIPLALGRGGSTGSVPIPPESTDSAPLATTRSVPDPGWVPLFDGKSLEGWHPIPERNWAVVDGLLTGDGPNSYCFTKRGDFQDFVLRAEVRLPPEANSGIFFRCHPGESLPVGWEARMGWDRGVSAFGSLFVTRKPIADVRSSNPGLVRPGEWATVEVSAIDRAITISVDGVRCLTHTDSTHDPVAGRIGLQAYTPDHPVEFRSIQIREVRR